MFAYTLPGGAAMKLRVVNQSRFLLVVLMLAVLLVFCGWLVGARSAAYASQAGVLPASQGRTPTSLMVGAGDTLWDIAARHAPPDMDLRVAVYVLRTYNSLASANIQVGQKIAVPSVWIPQ